jgi:SNF2 family DNA or RNA helicase
MERTLILLITLFLSLSGLAQSDTLLYTFVETRIIKNKLTIKRLSLADIVTKNKSIPKEIRSFKNLEFLSLRPRATRFARPIGGGPCIIGYAKTKTTTLPSWINELESLEELDLIGINNVDYSQEIAKLVPLTKLRDLSIDPDHFDDQLLKVLIQFNKLKSLKIRTTLTDEQIRTLKRELPNCEIVTGLYADY